MLKIEKLQKMIDVIAIKRDRDVHLSRFGRGRKKPLNEVK